MKNYTQEFIDFVSSAVKYGQKTSFLALTEDSLNPDEGVCLEKTKTFVRSFNRFPTEKWFADECELPLSEVNDPFEYYRDKLYKKAIYKLVVPVLQEASTAIRDRDPLSVVDMFNGFLDKQKELFRGSSTHGWLSASEMSRQFINEYQTNKLGSGIRGVPTGWEYVDNQMGGHQKGDLNTIVARPGTGKTYVLLKMAYEALKNGNRVLFVSMEMSKKLLFRRLVGISTKNNPEHFRKYEVSSHFLDFFAGTELPKTDNFFLSDSGDIRSTAELDSAIEILQPDIVFVDSSYLLIPQKKQGNNASRREIISAVAEDLKAIAVKRNIPVVQSMQFNRQAKTESKNAKNPLEKAGIENIAEADVVGQLSSVVIGLANPTSGDTEKDFRYMGFLKGREGEQGAWKIRYSFNPVNFDFLEVIDGEDQTQQEENEDADLDEANFNE